MTKLFKTPAKLLCSVLVLAAPMLVVSAASWFWFGEAEYPEK